MIIHSPLWLRPLVNFFEPSIPFSKWVYWLTHNQSRQVSPVRSEASSCFVNNCMGYSYYLSPPTVNQVRAARLQSKIATIALSWAYSSHEGSWLLRYFYEVPILRSQTEGTKANNKAGLDGKCDTKNIRQSNKSSWLKSTAARLACLSLSRRAAKSLQFQRRSRDSSSLCSFAPPPLKHFWYHLWETAYLLHIPKSKPWFCSHSYTWARDIS